jgi:hypothetical protein
MRALDHQQQQVALRCEAGRAGVALGRAQEATERLAELRDRRNLGGGQFTCDASS